MIAVTAAYLVSDALWIALQPDMARAPARARGIYTAWSLWEPQSDGLQKVKTPVSVILHHLVLASASATCQSCFARE